MFTVYLIGTNLVSTYSNSFSSFTYNTKVEKLNVAGDRCIIGCSHGQFISLLGDRCLELCPVGAYPNATNSEQCECSVDQFISANGAKCLNQCPYYAEDQDLDHHCNG